jgi:hypothetical protein
MTTNDHEPSRTKGFRVDSGHVVGDVFDDGEAAVIDLRNGIYFSLNSTGALLWPLLVEGTTVDALVARVISPSDQVSNVAPAIESFVAALAAAGLIEEVDDVDAEAIDRLAAADRPPFVPPELERFDDLQDLLLLDPIHDVSDRGWPETPPG